MKISSPRHLRRRQRLAELVAEAGGATALALLVGTPKSHISAMLAGTRGVGDALAAKLETKMEKESGWMDDLPVLGAHAGRLVKLHAELAEIRSLDPDRFEMLADMLDAVAESIRRTHAILLAQRGHDKHAAAPAPHGYPRGKRHAPPSAMISTREAIEGEHWRHSDDQTKEGAK